MPGALGTVTFLTIIVFILLSYILYNKMEDEE
jgi:hypothetical protein